MGLSRRDFIAGISLLGLCAGAAAGRAGEGAIRMSESVKAAARDMAELMWRWIGDLSVPGEVRGTVRPKSGAEPTLLACCDAAMILYILGLTDRVGPERKAWASVIQSAQREDGSFGSLHSFGMAVRALNCLGEPLLRKPTFQEQWDDPQALLAWLEGRNWSQPWGASIEVLHVACPRTDLANGGGMMVVHPGWGDAMLGWLAGTQEPGTGLWAPGHEDEVDLFNKMGAAFHFFPFYAGWSRPLPRAEAMIDSVLSLQRPDGTFGGGFADMDACHMLATLSGQVDHRRGDVQAAFQGCFKAYSDRYTARDAEGAFRDLHNALAAAEALCQLCRVLAPASPMATRSGWDPRLWRVRWLQQS